MNQASPLITKPLRPGFGAEVIACRGSPGAPASISIDVVIHYPEGDRICTNIPLFNPPRPRITYDVYGPDVGSGVGLNWRGNETRFMFEWDPVTTLCGGTPPGLLPPSILDPYKPARATVMAAAGGPNPGIGPPGGGGVGSGGSSGVGGGGGA